MRIASISITNICGLKSFQSKLGSVCIISGAHGVGKSSIERALVYSLGRRPLADKGSRSVQHDPSMLHGQADKGEAILTFDEESPIEYLRVVVKADKTQREVKTRGSKKWEDAGPFIDDITSALAYDPMQFKNLDPKQRLEAFLRVVPVEITADEISAAVGDVIPIAAGKPGLDTINAIYDDIYKLRTSENVAADTQAKHAAQLEAALPPAVDGGNWNAEVTRLRGEKTTLEASEAEEVKRIGDELQRFKNAASIARQSADQEIDKEINDKIAALEADRGNRKAATAQEATDAVEADRQKANSEVREIKEANAPLHAKLLADIAVADERSRSTARAEGTRQAAKVARAEVDTRKAKSKAMTEALERLTALKASVAGRMKIKGINIASPRDGMPVDLCREEDGALVPFSIWNSAAQDQFCLRIAVLHRGPCGLVCVDNMSNWSPERQKAVIDTCKRYAASDNMQFLLGKATDDGELTVEEV